MQIKQNEKDIIKLVLRVQHTWNKNDVKTLSQIYRPLILKAAKAVVRCFRVGLSDAYDEAYAQFLQLIANFKAGYTNDKKKRSFRAVYFSHYLEKKLLFLSLFVCRKLFIKRKARSSLPDSFFNSNIRYKDHHVDKATLHTCSNEYRKKIKQELGQKCVQIFDLKLQGYTQREIAKKIGLKQTQTCKYLARIRNFLRQQIKGE